MERIKIWFDNYPRLENVLIIIGIILISIFLVRLLRALINRYFLKTAKNRSELTGLRFIKNTVSLIVFTIACILILYSIPQLKSLGVTLFAGAGILTIVIGFASQAAFANIVSGVFIVIFKPFRVNDLIKIGTDFGFVEDITLRHTVITNFENRRIIIPNSVINDATIINSSIHDDSICNHVEIGISYDSPQEKALQILRECCEAHRHTIDNRTEEEKEAGKPIVNTRIVSFGDSSVNLRAYTWSKTPLDGIELKFDLNKVIKKRFDEEGIEIPYPHRTIVMKNK